VCTHSNTPTCNALVGLFYLQIQHHFYELPGTSHHSLRDSLLNHISSCDSQTSVVVTQLSLAIADLALLMAAWENAVADLLTKFAPNPASYPVLLEILTVLPEEVRVSLTFSL